MQFKDYYQVLGVAADADEKAVKAAYRRLARKYHPDVSKEPDAESQFKSVNEAYEVLGDAARRTEYDRLRASGYRPGDEFQAPPWAGQGQGGPGFEDFGDSGFSDFFESLFGRGRSAGAGRARAPADVRAHLDINLEAAYAGSRQRIEVNGRTLEVKIPAGIVPGQSIRLKGQGGNGRDLLLEIGYRPHAQYELEGRNVIVRRPIPPWLAVFGGKIEVPTLGGNVSLNVPAGSDTGRRMRLRGRGLPGNPPGDQFVVLDIQAPSPTSDAQCQAYRELAQAFGETIGDTASD